MKSYSYFMTLPLMVEGAMDRIIAVLVKRGYTVSGGFKDATYLSQPGNVVVLFALNLSRQFSEKELEAEVAVYIQNDVLDILEITKTRYYFLNIRDNNNINISKYTLGNISVELRTENKLNVKLN